MTGACITMPWSKSGMTGAMTLRQDMKALCCPWAGGGKGGEEEPGGEDPSSRGQQGRPPPGAFDVQEHPTYGVALCTQHGGGYYY